MLYVLQNTRVLLLEENISLSNVNLKLYGAQIILVCLRKLFGVVLLATATKISTNLIVGGQLRKACKGQVQSTVPESEDFSLSSSDFLLQNEHIGFISARTSCHPEEIW